MTCLRKCHNNTVKVKMLEIEGNMETESSLDNPLLKVLTYLRNIRKAKTEKSSLQEPSRESGIWWKPFMRNADENHSRAVKPKAIKKYCVKAAGNQNKMAVKHCRMPALKDKICWNLK